MKRFSWIGFFAILCALAGLSSPARAHDVALSGIRILDRGTDTVVTVTTPISRLQRSEGSNATTMTAAEMDTAIRQRLQVRFGGKHLRPTKAHVIGDTRNDLVTWQTVVPGSPNDCEIMARLYPEDANSRMAVSLVRDGQVIEETLLDASHPDRLSQQAPPTVFSVALRYIREGIEHIFGGPDHVLFVLGLLLLGGTLKSLLRTVTAFTLAHSITLTLATTNIFSPSPQIVEPLIALSIIAIAVENLRHFRRDKVEPSQDLRAYFAFGFGLIHGFGFAGALREVGLPMSALGAALASFNVGVEVGQVAIILMAVPCLAWLGKKNPVFLMRTIVAGSVFIGIAGVYWFITRLGI